MENKELTPVEWLFEKVMITHPDNLDELLEQAKQMEEKQKKDEYLRGYVEGIDSGSSYHPD